MKLKADRLIKIDEHIGMVFDSLLNSNEINEIYRIISSSSFSMNASSSLETVKYNEVMNEFDNKDFSKHFLFSYILKALKTLSFKKKDIECNEVLVNCNRYGGYSFMHQDVITDGFYTIVYYVNNHWEEDWGGETILCNNIGEPIECVSFKPGRLLIFPSKMNHIAGVPSIECKKFRYSISVRVKISSS